MSRVRKVLEPIAGWMSVWTQAPITPGPSCHGVECINFPIEIFVFNTAIDP